MKGGIGAGLTLCKYTEYIQELFFKHVQDDPTTLSILT